ncbi:MAG: acetyltransferase [Microbacteriaceae bacterium]|nr:MAG: acetyltransferase [Microbacteriaceae bacterium]
MTNLAPQSPDSPARPVSARASSTRHFAGLDGLRALAVVAVLVYHLFPGLLPGGFIGVDVFFVISGFLITSLLIGERATAGRLSLRRFWQRRVRRLVPALVALVLACCTMALIIGGDVLVGLSRQVLGAATFSYNWLDIAAGSSYFSRGAPELFRNLWSLAVEEQFYLVWPFVLIVILLIRNNRVRIAVLLMLAAASAALMWLLYMPGSDATRVYFGTDTHSFGLMIGAALALIVPSVSPLNLDAGESPLQVFVRRWLPGLGLISLVAVLTATWWLHDDATITYHGGLVAISVLTAIVIWAAVALRSTHGSSAARSALGRALDASPLRAIGARSYGLYLWHWPALVLVSASWPRGADTPERMLLIGTVALIVTVAAAALSYRFVEQPVRRHGFRGVARTVRGRVGASRRGRVSAVAGLTVIAVTLAGTGAALVTAPAETSAQAFIERGVKAVRQEGSPAASGRVSAATPGRSAAPSTGAASNADPTPGASGAESMTQVAVDPRHKPIPSGDQLDAIGDSVMLASAPELQAIFPGIAIDAVVSRQLRAAPDIVRSMAAAGTLRKALIIGLGTNGSISADSLENIRQTIGPDRELVLVTVQAPRSWTPGVNDTLRAFAAQHSRTVALADWQTAIAPHLDVLADDQIHPGAAGGRIYAATVRAALQRLADLPPIDVGIAQVYGPTLQPPRLLRDPAATPPASASARDR